jgi:hypothetical protein
MQNVAESRIPKNNPTLSIVFFLEGYFSFVSDDVVLSLQKILTLIKFVTFQLALSGKFFSELNNGDKFGTWKLFKFRSNYDHLFRERRKFDEDVTKYRKRNRNTPRTAGINKQTHLQAQRKRAQV